MVHRVLHVGDEEDDVSPQRGEAATKQAASPPRVGVFFRVVLIVRGARPGR
ncbi:MAG: hypothetical protein HYX75_24990 [Acidobacteria bacterium]|nr:hypothetical protein [Acidobacteriota bacterium]